jgi:hypothetical protein
MSLQSVFELVGGAASLALGLVQILTRRAALGVEGEEPHMWVYGWRAIALGAVSIAVAVLLFASAAGVIQWFR